MCSSIALLAYFLVFVSMQANGCVTESGTGGECINISQCASVSDLLIEENPSSIGTLLQFHQVQCGFDKLEPKVCCDTNRRVEKECLPFQPVEAETLFESRHFGKRDECRLPNNEIGTCIRVDECASIYSTLRSESSITKDTLEVLKKRLCGLEKMMPKVCCHHKTPTTPSTIITATPPKPELQDVCITPQRRKGVCINIKRCQPIIVVVKQSREFLHKLSETLKELHCGFENMDPKVCCEAEQTNVLEPFIIASTNESVPSAPVITNYMDNSLLEHELCGPLPAVKIFHGTKTNVFEFPWMALLAYASRSEEPEFRCGGSLITKKHVLTAAHCVTMLPMDLQLVGVRLGEYDLSKDRDCDTDSDGTEINCAEEPQDFKIQSVVVHPDYAKEKPHDDIALITLAGVADFTAANVRPICLPVNRMNMLDSKVIVTGWGATESAPKSKILQKITLPVVPNEQCTKIYDARGINIWHKQMCAGGSTGADSCSGDSGGPLQARAMYNEEPRYTIYGIVSFGPRTCGINGIPGVYTKVVYYVDWILDTISTK